MRRLLSLVLVLAVAGLAVGVWVSYSAVEVQDPRLDDFSVAFTDDAGDILQAGIALFNGDLAEAADLVVDGIDLKIVADVHNSSFLPVYIPGLAHTVHINDLAVATVTAELDEWIGPGETAVATSQVVVSVAELSGSFIEGITRGGEVEIEVETTYSVLLFSGEERSEVFRFNLLEQLRDFLP